MSSPEKYPNQNNLLATEPNRQKLKRTRKNKKTDRQSGTIR